MICHNNLIVQPTALSFSTSFSASSFFTPFLRVQGSFST